MKTRTVLLYLPGLPYDITALFPKRVLALIAGALMEGGHEAEVWDYGTLESVVAARDAQRGAPRAVGRIASLVAGRPKTLEASRHQHLRVLEALKTHPP